MPIWNRETSREPASKITVSVDGQALELSNLDKVLYPAAGFTKGEVIDYYSRMAGTILPHLLDRPLTRIRYPNGVDKAGFFEKNVPAGLPHWVRHETLPSPGSSVGRDTIDYVVVDGLASLVWLANLAALELHVPQWKVGSEGPDLIVIDLDPGPSVGLAECAEVALLLRARMADDGIARAAEDLRQEGHAADGADRRYAVVGDRLRVRPADRPRAGARRIRNWWCPG